MFNSDKILETLYRDFLLVNKIKKNDILLVALSGGMDSMCLIDALYKLQVEIGYKIIAIHINHGIRGEEADRDMRFVEDYCKSMNVELIVEKVDALKHSKNNKQTVEEAARALRYKAFGIICDSISKKYKKNKTYIVVAHHTKDQVETVIHNMLRGTGLKGIAAMKKQNGNILRPLIDISKKEIEEYVNKYDVPYVEDSTNEDVQYTRNFIRTEIISKLEKVNNAAINHIIELSKQARELNDYVEKECEKAYKKVLTKNTATSISIDLSKFNSKENVIKAGIVKKAFDELVGTLKDITKVNINDIISLSEKEKGGHLDLPYNITLDKKKNELIFKKNKESVSMSRRKKK